MELIESIRATLPSVRLGSVILFREYLNTLQKGDYNHIISEKLKLNQTISHRFPHKILIETMIRIEDATMFVLDMIIPEDFIIPAIRIDWDFVLHDGPEYLNTYGVRQRLLDHANSTGTIHAIE
uniref:Uncharacterized protein n=1 Tax=viral metagenome TaxID=1070528 RepID=A0A6C0CJL1_9ZZZZ